MIKWIRGLLERWLGVADIQAKNRDLAKTCDHFRQLYEAAQKDVMQLQANTRNVKNILSALLPDLTSGKAISPNDGRVLAAAKACNFKKR